MHSFTSKDEIANVGQTNNKGVRVMSGSKILVASARKNLDELKYEIARRLGVPNYKHMDRGAIPARVHGYIGASMTKTLVTWGEEIIAYGRPSFHIAVEGEDQVRPLVDPQVLAILGGEPTKPKLHVV